MQQNPIPSTSAESHGDLAIKVSVQFWFNKSFHGKVVDMKNGDKIKDIQPKIRLLFDILPKRRLVLYRTFDTSKTPLDDEYVLQDHDCLCFSEIESSDSSDTEGSHTSDDVEEMLSNSSSNEEEKRLLADDERWLQQYFQKKFGLTKRF